MELRHGSNEEKIQEILQDSISIRQEMLNSKMATEIDRISRTLVSVINGGGTIYLAGNGGSAADAQHFAAELVGRFYKMERRALPAVSLTTNTSTLTALGNDYDYSIVFIRQLEAFLKPFDAFIGISTSGNAESILKAFKHSKKIGATTIFLTGATGGKISEACTDLAHTLNVPHKNTGRIQEVHITIIHALCELIEHELFEKQK